MPLVCFCQESRAGDSGLCLWPLVVYLSIRWIYIPINLFNLNLCTLLNLCDLLLHNIRRTIVLEHQPSLLYNQCFIWLFLTLHCAILPFMSAMLPFVNTMLSFQYSQGHMTPLTICHIEFNPTQKHLDYARSMVLCIYMRWGTRTNR